MSNPGLTDSECIEALRLIEKHGGVNAASRAIGMHKETLRNRVMQAQIRGLSIGSSTDEPRDRIRELEAQLRSAKSSTIDAEYVKRRIIKLAESDANPPSWLVAPPKRGEHHGVPTLFASDWHWGEVVDSRQVNGVNSYDVAIAQERARALVNVAIELLRTHLADQRYPGIVFALGGDMVSGDIHEELSVTNETEIMPMVIDLFGVLIWCITALAKEFGNVFVPAVTGNHGRITQKMRSKGRAFTSFDWLLYQLLAKHFEGDKRVRFLIPDGPDAFYRVYGHRYLMSHGDQFKGGDGMIGALGPIIRGDHRKRSRNGQIDLEYDTLIIGHWHQLIQMQRIIVNGSLKGYDEYANSWNFPFEPPRQALWITHPEFGITFSAPVLVERAKRAVVRDHWILWEDTSGRAA